jgi:predicted histone-like DNA-binding protein
MPILYKLQQDNRKNSTNKGKWYARSVMNGTVSTSQLAEIMQRNCTVKRSDILAVLSELVETMQDQLQNSMRVKLDGFGSFKIGLKTSAANTAKDFNASKKRGGDARELLARGAHQQGPHPQEDSARRSQGAGDCQKTP